MQPIASLIFMDIPAPLRAADPLPEDAAHPTDIAIVPDGNAYGSDSQRWLHRRTHSFYCYSARHLTLSNSGFYLPASQYFGRFGLVARTISSTACRSPGEIPAKVLLLS